MGAVSVEERAAPVSSFLGVESSVVCVKGAPKPGAKNPDSCLGRKGVALGGVRRGLWEGDDILY